MEKGVWAKFMQMDEQVETRVVFNLPKARLRHTSNMVNIPEIWSTYQKYCQHTAKKELGNISGKKI